MFSRIRPALQSGRNTDSAVAAWRALERGHNERIEKLWSALEDAPGRRADKHLRCRSCGFAIARDDDRIRMLDNHEHTCANPHGIVFHIGCFREAVGAAAIGEETSEDTWFAGYGWRILICARCGTHLGWVFRTRGGDRFCGLILDRLTVPE